MATDESPIAHHATREAPREDPGQGPGQLRGNLGTASPVSTVIAYNGPVIILAGFVPLVIAAGNGLGAP